MQLHISNDRPAPQSLPDGVKWCPAVGKMADGTTNDWPEVPTLEWAERLLYNVPIDHSGMLLLDYEGIRHRHLYHGTKKEQADAVTVLRKQANVIRTARKKALHGFYAGPEAPHQWPGEEYADDGVSFGFTKDLLNRQKAIFPMCYLFNARTGENVHHFKALLNMGRKGADFFGTPWAACVSPRNWEHGELNSENAWDAYTEVIDTIAPYGCDIILWEAEEYFIRTQREKSVNRPLNESELAACKEIAQANNDKAFEIMRRYVK